MNWLNKSKNNDASALSNGLEGLSVEFRKLKHRARIAFIDDNRIEVESHIKRLQKDGYNVFYFDDIQSVDLVEGHGFHILILDIEGIGNGIVRDGGWGLLRHFKSYYPEIGIVILTGSVPNLFQYKELSDLADYVLSKNDYIDNFLRLKELLDSLIQRVFNEEYQYNAFQIKLSRYIEDERDQQKILSLLRDKSKSRVQILKSIKSLKAPQDIVRAADNYLTVVNSIIDFSTSIV